MKTAKKAQEAARAGKIDDALAALARFADGGDAGAAAALAELHAFRGEWDAVLLRAAPLLADPEAVSAGNVAADLAGLVWRAAGETKRHKDALKILGPGNDFLIFSEVRRWLKAGGKGKPPRIRTVDAPAHQKKVYERTIADADDALSRFLAAASFPLYDAQAVAAFKSAAGELDWEQTLDAARAFVRQGKPDGAWKAVEPKLAEWSPVEPCQVAPAELVYDPDLFPMMTAARCRKVLQTSRG
jgi:hypothetical protein